MPNWHFRQLLRLYPHYARCMNYLGLHFYDDWMRLDLSASAIPAVDFAIVCPKYKLFGSHLTEIHHMANGLTRKN